VVPAFTVPYRFCQRFRVAARRAYEWCTDYRTDDLALMGEKGRRKISKLSNDTILFKETFPRPRGRAITKVKLIRLDRKHLSWTNTHLSGPARYSQFLYRIVPEGRDRSRLEFSGFQLERTRHRPTPAQKKLRARRLLREDSHAWELLARAMESDLTP
jgi:hypothetical protein